MLACRFCSHCNLTVFTFSRSLNTRPPTVFEAIAELWNSPHFNPTAPASECHFDFVNAIDCSYEQVAGLSPATPQKIEDIIVSIRSDLLRIITRWEQSGQGEGGRDPQEEEEEERGDDDESGTTSDDDLSPRRRDRSTLGGLTGRPPRALQSRASFLNGRPSYLLYYWEVADAHQLLQSSLQRLNNNTGASDALSAPSTASGSSRAQRRRQHQDPEESSSFIPLVQSIKELAECHRQLVLDRAEDRQHERQLEQQRQESQGAQQTREWHFRRRAELTDLARKYRKLDAELDINDENSRRLSEFYVEEGRLLQEEIRQLDRSSGCDEDTSNNGA